MTASHSNPGEAAGDALAASPVRRVRLTPAMLRELRLALLVRTLKAELELVEELYLNGDVVVRLGNPDKPQDGELILGHRSEAQPVQLQQMFGE